MPPFRYGAESLRVNLAKSSGSGGRWTSRAVRDRRRRHDQNDCVSCLRSFVAVRRTTGRLAYPKRENVDVLGASSAFNRPFMILPQKFVAVVRKKTGPSLSSLLLEPIFMM